jgi:hypothetical protein
MFFLQTNQNNYFVVNEIDEELFNEFNLIELKECISSKSFILLTYKSNKFIGESYEKILEKNIYQFELEKIDYSLISKINFETSKRSKRPSIRSCGNFIYQISGENDEVLLKWENDTIKGNIYFDSEIRGLYINKNRKVK